MGLVGGGASGGLRLLLLLSQTADRKVFRGKKIFKQKHFFLT